MTTLQAIAIPTGTWQLDAVHSSVEYLITDTFSRFVTEKGWFSDIDGTLTTTEDLAGWHVSGVVRPASLSTGNAQRDAHLRSADFLNADAFPEIRYESDSFEQVGDNVLRVTGRISIQGQAQPITTDVTVLGQGRTEDGTERVVLSGTGSISFGPMTVQVTVHASAAKQA